MKGADSMPAAAPAQQRVVAVLVFPGIQSLDVTGPLEVFALANLQLQEMGHVGDDAYRLILAAPSPGKIVTSCGIKLDVDVGLAELAEDPIDTLLVPGGMGDSVAVQQQNDAILCWLREQAHRVRRIGSVCSGALLLAAAGLLDGRRATTHWLDVDELRSYPNIEVDPDAIYVRDGNVYTSAGITSGIDLALALVEEDWGRALALAVARRMVLYLKRDGGQQQYSTHLANQISSDQFAGLVEWLHRNLHKNISVESMAEQCAMSPRNFARRFVAETGDTPSRFLEKARVEKSRQLLLEKNLSLEKIAQTCGFNSAEQLRRAFYRHLGVLPSDYRKRF